VFQVYGWEEKKAKTWWGGTSVDYEKLAQARICGMTTADLKRFVAFVTTFLNCRRLTILMPPAFDPPVGHLRREEVHDRGQSVASAESEGTS
jgi:hypothetical protein